MINEIKKKPRRCHRGAIGVDLKHHIYGARNPLNLQNECGLYNVPQID